METARKNTEHQKVERLAKFRLHRQGLPEELISILVFVDTQIMYPGSS